MIKTIIKEQVSQALKTCGFSAGRDFNVEVPPNTEFGDYSTNAAMVLCKENKKAPKEMAEALVKELKKNKYFKKLKIDGPGFINIFLAPPFIKTSSGKSMKRVWIMPKAIMARVRKCCWNL